MRYLPEAHRYHRALRALGITVDMVAPGADVSDYDLVIAPTLYTVTDAASTAIANAAAAGATVLITPFTGIVDERDAVIAGGYPGAFRDLLGLTIDEFRPLAAGATVTLSSGAHGSIWSDAMRVADAEVVATFEDGPASASPAITRRSVGAGAAWYVSTVLDDDGLRALVRKLAAEAGVPMVEVGDDVDVVTRRTGTETFTFVINHRSVPIAVPYAGLDLVTGETVSDATPLPAGAVRVVMSERSDRGA
jgi:beta-galactosidase